jgi:DNA-binding response OmpR family regulator
VQFVDSAEHTLNTSTKKRILLVDDEVDITTTYRMALEEAGFQVDAYNDSSLALSEYKPGMNGFELYEKIKGSKTDQKPRVCFITAFEVYYQALKELFPGDDVDCFLSKPISLDELVKTVKSELGLL